jgi:hypothetical protein
MLLATIKWMILPEKLYKQTNQFEYICQIIIAPLVLPTGLYVSCLLQVFSISYISSAYLSQG